MDRLTAYVRKIVAAYIGASTKDSCGYGCSDHASAYSNGFPAAYVCDEPDKTSSPYIHSPKDVSPAFFPLLVTFVRSVRAKSGGWGLGE